MADNNKNPRRTIWLSETEPLSHYDIWLSKNQYLNSDGDPISTSNVLRPCDYIFKVWDCGDWHPIVGLNSTALNKINTVKNLGYTSTNPNTGHAINSFSYLEFHLPLFTNIDSSPSELFDAGTIGLAILEYVTKEEWLDIFEGDAFSYAFKWYIEGGDTNINLAINPAEADKLGGIYADEFQEEDIFFEDFNNHSTSLINNANNYWLAKAKYKLGYNTSRPEDYNLYISAKDIINIVNKYLEDNHDEPGITPGGGAIINPEVLYNSFLDSESIKRDWDGPILDASKPRFSLWGTSGSTALTNNAGKFLKIRDDAATWGVNPGQYSDINNALEWQSAQDIVIEGTGYDTAPTKKYLSCQNGTFNWETSIGNPYYGSTTISINQNNVISIAPYPNAGDVYLRSLGGNVSWQPIDAGTTYILGVGISINNTNNTININTNNAIEGLVLSYDGHGDVEWRNVQSGEEYDAGYGILITDDNVINGVIRNNNETYIARSHISFNCVIEASTDPLKGITMTLDLDSSTNTILYPYSYTEVTIGTKSMPASLSFTLLNLMNFMEGCPVYVLINVPNEPTNVSIDTTNSSGTASVININDAIIEDNSVSCLDIDHYTKFLCTLQFGILKVEPLESVSSSNNS